MAVTGSTETVLEYRMYFFVPYNISPIQQAIQAGHAALEYANLLHNYEGFKEFMKWKTWIILNGGTTNTEYDENGIPLGTMNQLVRQLDEQQILFTEFYEPDLNNALTAICFICDERVFNREVYLDWEKYIEEHYNTGGNLSLDELREVWVKMLGGEKNAFLRELIKDKKLA